MLENLIILLFFPTMLFAQDKCCSICYEVKDVVTHVEMEEISKKRITFGIKQMMEDVISENNDLCVGGSPVEIIVHSIEAPQTGIQIGPWTKTKKQTIVTLHIYKDGKVIESIGKAKTTVESTFIDLQNEELPFNKTTFASAVKKAIEKSLK